MGMRVVSWSMVVMAVVVVASAPAPAHAQDWHVGLNVRSELGTHPVRIDGGVRVGRLDLIAVLDPMFWIDGEIDVDLIAAWRIGDYAVFGGWRPASIAFADERQFQHAVLAGVLGRLPSVGPLDLVWGFEVAAVVVQHGGNAPTEMLSLDSMSDVGDSFNASMFLRVGFGNAE
jgi:hypothetical protein